MKKELSSNNRLDQMLKICFIVFFFFLLFLPRIQQKTHFFYYNLIDENRTRTLKPDGNIVVNFLKDSSGFPKKYEKYFNDNYGLRDPMIRVKNSLDRRAFKYSDEVAFGPDDWMEYRNVIENQEIANERLTEEEFNTIVKRFNQLSVDLKKKNIELIVVPIPNKNSIYPEIFDNEKIIRPRPTTFERFTSILRASPNFHTIDVASILKNKKNDLQVFYKTDFHWNEIGAYHVSEELVNTMGQIAKTGTKWAIPFDIRKQAFQGVLNGSLSTVKLPTETGYFIEDAKITTKQKLIPRTLMIGDSFSMAMKDIQLADHFVTLDGYDLVHSNSLYTQIQQNPDIKYVIFEFIELDMAEYFDNPSWWEKHMK